MKRRNLIASTSMSITVLLGLLVCANSAAAVPEPEPSSTGMIFVAHGVVFDQHFEPIGDVEDVGERLQTSGDDRLRGIGDQLISY